MLQILLATNNAKKLDELRRIVAEAGLDLEIMCLADFPAYDEPAENEWTFEGNALIKARAGRDHTGLPTLADDSGLCVEALNNMPGVRSSRWAGPGHDDQANLDLVLAQIDDVEDPWRRASFVSAVALVTPMGKEIITRGDMPGKLITQPRGERGFGYDPIFVPVEEWDLPEDQQRTTAELSAEEKDAISHRGKALRAMVPFLQSYVEAHQ